MYPAFVVKFDVPLPDDANPAGAAAASAAEGPTPKRARVAAGASPFTFGAAATPSSYAAPVPGAAPFTFGAAPPSAPARPTVLPFTFGAQPVPAARPASPPGFAFGLPYAPSAGSLPGDFTDGEKVYFIESSFGTWTLTSSGAFVADDVAYGQEGVVTDNLHMWQDHVPVRFKGNKGVHGCRPEQLSREPPAAAAAAAAEAAKQATTAAMNAWLRAAAAALPATPHPTSTRTTKARRA